VWESFVPIPDPLALEILGRHATAEELATWNSVADVINSADGPNFVEPLVRLYVGMFGRLPDTVDPNADFDHPPQSGFWTNVNLLRSGQVSLIDMAEAFAQSQEGFSHFGVAAQLHIPPSSAFIENLYETLLNRHGSGSEITAWQDLHLDIAHVVLGFTESAEYKAISYSFEVVPEAPPPAPTIYDQFLTEVGAAHPDQHINVIGSSAAHTV
jgi:hypothetical protein